MLRSPLGRVEGGTGYNRPQLEIKKHPQMRQVCDEVGRRHWSKKVKV